MSQHFLLSAAARTLSLSDVARMSDEEAHAKFAAIRWSDNDGQPYLPEMRVPHRVWDPLAQNVAMQGLRQAVLGHVWYDVREPEEAD